MCECVFGLCACPAAHVLQILDELQDLLVVEHCLDIITWLEQHKGMLSSPAYKGGLQQVRRSSTNNKQRITCPHVTTPQRAAAGGHPTLPCHSWSELTHGMSPNLPKSPAAVASAAWSPAQ